MFDGLHQGHRAVVRAAVEESKRIGGRSGILTFWPHPSAVLRPDKQTKLFQQPALKREIAASLGVDYFIEQPFDLGFASIPASTFPSWLKKRIPDLEGLYAGENWRFGQGGAGTTDDLKGWASEAGFKAVALRRVIDSGKMISSSAIREYLLAGNLEEANHLLGYCYTVEGSIMEGRQLGRKIGFPTVNLSWEPDLIPKTGVYAVSVAFPSNNRKVSAIANLGYRPTVEDSQIRPILEVHLLEEFDETEIRSPLRVSFLKFVRAEQKFVNVEALREQIAKDVEAVRGW